MSEVTSQQTEEEYIQAMGKELGALFYRLYSECNWLHWKW
jgi:hypothetical protein